jgi:predicted DCC family thiol-disulfide oxidoreductase YuxK
LKHSWTGGQYSAWRALFGVALAVEGAQRIEDLASRVAWIALCLALSAGIRDRFAALVLAVAAIAGDAWVLAPMLLLHAATHGSPYGSFSARGRADPGGNWILPRWNFALRRLVALGAAVLCIARGELVVGWPLASALALAACDPGWIPRKRGAAPARVFYDGTCGLCHRFVRLLLAEDFDGRTIRFAPLDSETARSTFDESVRASLPDSVVVRTAEGEALVRSRGALHVLARLGGLWRLLGALLRIVPRPVLDLLYDGLARVRYRLFARAETACPIVPRHLAARFDL